MAELIAAPRATELLARMANRRIVVVGDMMVDEWIWGDVSRISPEAPVPVVAVREHTFTLGGAGNVANNLRALGAHIALVACVGDDSEGRRLRAMLEGLGVDAHGVLTVAGRPTTRKTRVVARGQQVVRADWESTHSYFREDAAAGLIALSIWRKGFQSGGLGTDSLHHCAPPRSQESLNSAWVRPASS